MFHCMHYRYNNASSHVPTYIRTYIHITEGTPRIIRTRACTRSPHTYVQKPWLLSTNREIVNFAELTHLLKSRFHSRSYERDTEICVGRTLSLYDRWRKLYEYWKERSIWSKIYWTRWRDGIDDIINKNIVLAPRMLDVSFRAIANPLGRQKDKVIYTFKCTRNNVLRIYMYICAHISSDSRFVSRTFVHQRRSH